MSDDSTVPGADASPAHVSTADTAERAKVLGLLSQHVPLSLLLDLSSPGGPDSEQILEAEGAPEDAWWEPVPPPSGTPA